MLTETGKTLFTLPFCARRERDTGWPPGDNTVLEYILMSQDDQLSIETHITFIAFLAAIFAEMEDVLKSFGTLGIDALRQKWHTHMEPAQILTRDYFYANVLERTKKIESKIWNSNIPRLPHYDPHSGDSRREFFAQLAECVMDLWRRFLNDQVISLLNVIPNKQVLLVYMDEAHTFGQRYWALQRVLFTLKDHKMLWFSFMGTNASLLSEFVPAAYRLLEETLRSAFDQNIIDISPHQTVTMGQARSLDWICAFGRPSSCAVSAGGVYKVLELFQNTRTKLLCSTSRFNCNDIDQVFAVLAYTVCLDLVLGNQKAMEFVNTSVAKHMRLLIDPVLALAAASIVLTSTLCVGLVDKGRHGDLLARMVLFLARIQIFVLFLKTLFGELWDETPGHARFEKDLEGGYVNFYHFTLTEEAMPVKEDQ
ncbi:hypothetical protein JOM56_003061 [Amanita muscaria]